jgi:hypothetical protein
VFTWSFCISPTAQSLPRYALATSISFTVTLAVDHEAKPPRSTSLKWLTANRRFEFQKRSELFIGVHNEALTVVAMCVCNPDCSPARIHSRDAAPTPTGFAQNVSDYFPVPHMSRAGEPSRFHCITSAGASPLSRPTWR